MTIRVPEGLLWLIAADCLLRIGGYRSLLWLLRRPGVRRDQPRGARETALAAYRTVSLASGWYVRSARCLPRAAATSILLRTRGIQSVVVLGIRTTPFVGHAWVEVNGEPVGEEPWEIARYTELTRITVTP